MGLVQGPVLLAAGAQGRKSAGTPGKLRHTEAGDHPLAHDNEEPALHEHKRWSGQGRLEEKFRFNGPSPHLSEHQRLDQEAHALRALADGGDAESSLHLEFHDDSLTPINFPATAECVTTDLPSSAVAVTSFESTVLVGADNVWKRLQEALSAQGQCQSPPCCQVSAPTYHMPLIDGQSGFLRRPVGHVGVGWQGIRSLSEGARFILKLT